MSPMLLYLCPQGSRFKSPIANSMQCYTHVGRKGVRRIRSPLDNLALKKEEGVQG